MEKHRYFVLHKPIGVVSQFIYPHKRKKIVLGELYNFPKGTMAIGRLDVKSEGLLLLTTCGKTSEIMRSKRVEKEYYVQVDGLVNEQAIQQLLQSVEIGFNGKRYQTKAKNAYILPPNIAVPPCQFRIRGEHHGPTSWLSITLTEGKFRQVRKMTAAVGFPTLRLIRMRIGHIQLNNLVAGEVIELDSFKF